MVPEHSWKYKKNDFKYRRTIYIRKLASFTGNVQGMASSSTFPQSSSPVDAPPPPSVAMAYQGNNAGQPLLYTPSVP